MPSQPASAANETSSGVAHLAKLEPVPLDSVLAALKDSHAAPAAFPRALEEYARRVRGFVQSGAPAGHHDLFHDFIGRHRTTSHVAFRHWDGKALTTLTYRELDSRSAELAAAWLKAGVLPASCVCLLGQLEPELVVALAACFRLGALPALLPALGPRFVADRLDALEPSFLYSTAAALERVTAPPRAALLGFELGMKPFSGSHAYAAGRPALLVFAPLRPGKLPRSARVSPVALSAAEQRTAALRDGLLVYALEPGQELAAPGFPSLQCQPALLLAALAAGATYVHVSREQALAEPALLAGIHCLGLDLGLCTAIARGGVRLAARSWFRNPEETLDWAAWASALERTGLDEAFGANVLVDATLGGAVLASIRTRRAKDPKDSTARVHALHAHASHVHSEVLPVAGLASKLFDLADHERVSRTSVGLLAIGDGERAAPPYIVLATGSRLAALYAGTLWPRRVGAVVPCVELESFACRIQGVLGAVVLPVLASSPQRFELFVFATPPANDALAAAAALHCADAVRARLAAEFCPEELPDRVECLFVRPPLGKDGALDLARCQAGAVTGSLFRKARTPAFRRLARLYASLHASTDGGESAGVGAWA